MAQFEPLLWDRRPRRVRRPRYHSQGVPPIDASAEFGGTPLGKLGRRLLCDVELYLEFFALAHQPARGD